MGSPPFSFDFRHIPSFSHSLTSHSLNVPKPLQHLSIHSSTQFFRHTHSFSHFPFAQRAQTTSTPFNPLFHSIFQAHPLFLSLLHSFIFIPRLGCHQKVTKNPFTHSSQKLRHSLVLQERCDKKRVSFRPFGHHRSGHTRDPQQDFTAR